MFELDEYQQKAVIEPGNILLIAGAGAGKTFTITKKIEYLIKQNICKEEEILVISFTNKSVEDLKKKINYNCSIFTFHKLSMQILKDYNTSFSIVNDDYLEYIANEFFYTLDENEQEKLLQYFHEYDYNKFIGSIKYQGFIKLLTNIIRIFKTNNCQLNDLEKMFKIDSFFSKYAYVIKKIYDNDLKSRNSFDFDDLIIKATEVLDKFYHYKYIIVDEFQDTSKIRFNLINKLRIINNATLFAVGDDYQSIYHFSGCDLNIFLEFEKKIPNAKVLKLKYTYRNSQELINISSRFVNKNQKQIKKDLISHKYLDKPIKFIYYINPKKAFEKLYQQVYKEDSNILVLGRNNDDIKNFSKNPINYMTVHSAKGLEAENVIIINLVDDTYGFPNKLVNNQLLEILHPSDQNILFAEERRLFYVALTRSKNKVYLLVPMWKKSSFVKEIKKLMKN